MEDESSTAGCCEIGRLPEELLASIVSLVPSPRDACRAAAVSRAFRAAADSDDVWSRFLPRDLPRFAKNELGRRAPPSKKGLFRRLSQPALLPGKLMCMWLDRVTGTKCYAFPARGLQISWGNTSWYWRWIPLRSNDCFVQRGKRFWEAAELLQVCWLEIRGKIDSKMLSRNTTYAAYMVFKLAEEVYRLDSPCQEASISVGGIESTRQVCLQCCREDDGNHRIFPSAFGRPTREFPPGGDVALPRRRENGWKELELGEFYNEEGDDGEVCISLMETKGGWKRGLIVRGIEIRTKRQC